MKLKKYIVYFRATIYGSREVAAFDKEDAEDQIPTRMSAEEFECEQQVDVDVESVALKLR